MLSIHSIDKEKEEVKFVVMAKVDLYDYAIIDTTYKGDDVSNVFRHFYRFPFAIVRTGDTITLKTGTGENTRTNIPGSTFYNYTFYTGATASIWNDNQRDGVELLHVRSLEKKNA